MPNPNCYGAIEAVATRATDLTATGAPNVGANNAYVTTALMKADIKPELKAGAEELLENAANNICQVFEDCDKLRSVTIEIEVCSLEPDLAQLLVGGTALTSPGTGIYAAGQSGKTVGLTFPEPTDSCNNGVCLEFWQLAWDEETQATSNLFTGTTLTYTHWVFPKVLFQWTDFSISKEFTTWKFTGKARVNRKITANGPHDDWDTAVANAGGFTGLGGFFYDDAFPTAACGLITVPGVAS